MAGTVILPLLLAAFVFAAILNTSLTRKAQVVGPLSLMDLCIDALFSSIMPAALLHTQALLFYLPSIQFALGPQLNLNFNRKQARLAIKIVCVAVHISTQLPNLLQFCSHVDRQFKPASCSRASYAESSKPAGRMSFCCAVALRSADGLHHSKYEYLLQTTVCKQRAEKSLALAIISAETLINRKQIVKGAQTSTTCTRDMVYIKHLPISKNERAVCQHARFLTDILIKARQPF